MYDLKKERRYNGVYMISAVNRPSGQNKIGAAPTYSIIAKWSKETTPDYWESGQIEKIGTVPSGIKLKREVIDIPGSVFDGLEFAEGSFPRKFLKDELVRVPMDRKKRPIANKIEEIGYDVEETDEEEEAEAQKSTEKAPAKPAKPAFQPPTFKAGEKLSVRFYTAPNGSFPFTAFASKNDKGTGKRTWYKATYDGKDKDGDFVLSFSFDGTTDSYNLGDPEDEKTFLKEKVGWVRGHLKSAK